MTKHFTQIFAGSATALATTLMAAQGAYADSGVMYHGEGWGWGHMIFGSSMMIIAFVLVIFLIVLVVRRIGGSSGQEETVSPGDSAYDILRQRFARGDIDKEEFEQRMSVLIH